MFMPDFKKFDELAREFHVIPVCREFLADLETPVSMLGRFSADENVFLLESVEGGERFGRYSFLGIHPRGIFTVEDNKPFYQPVGGVKESLPCGSTPLFALRKLLGDQSVATYPGLPPLFGGAVGYLGYETVNGFEELPPPRKPLNGPAAALMLTDEMIAFDNVRHTIKVIVSVRPAEYPSTRAAYDDACARINAVAALFHTPFRVPAEPPVPETLPRLTSNMSKEEFCDMVEKCRRYIHDGEAIQVVLSQRFSAPAVSSPFQLYRALRLVNPSPYTFFLRVSDRVLVGSSPETMVKLEAGRSSLRPIAGTRKRGATPQRDRELADELLNDAKECAEHLMLVDLGRNDLGRTARPGSVQVREFMTVERYSHVMHLVSDVDALLDEKKDAFDLVKATFPAGTLSGAPKIRAMELINELEPGPRGTYGGAVGYFSSTGNMDLAITIRTLEIYQGILSMQAGAGIVFDSEPEKEYEETLNKAAAVFQSVKLAAAGLEI